MSNYYQYEFISPEPLFSLVKEEFSSYFDTQVVDDTLFPVWTERSLKKLGRSSYKIKETILFIEDFMQRLPSDFSAVREAWMCADVGVLTFRIPGVQYAEVNEKMFKIWENADFQCSPCETCQFPDMLTAVYKKQDTLSINFRKSFLLKPGNVSVKEECALDCKNMYSTATDTFDIRDNKFVTNFREGTVYLIYYANETDDNGVQLIPDNFRIIDFVEKYLKYKTVERLSNSVTDETFNQIQTKLQFYKQEADEAYVLAEIEIKKETTWQKRDAIEKSYNRNNKYQIRNRYGNRSRWR